MPCGLFEDHNPARKQTTIRRVVSVALTSTLLLLAARLSVAQPLLPGIEPDASTGKENNQNVFVRDSAIAQEKFDNAQKMERQKQWNNAASFYQEVLEKYADRVVPFAKDKDDVIIQYTSISNGVRDKLCHWPREGLDVYRSIYEPKAAALFDAARKAAAAGQEDAFALHEILRLYFVTETAKSAAIRLIDEKFDRGEFSAAAWLGDDLLNMHPNLLVERPGVLFRTALAYHLAGNKTAAEERKGQLTSKYPAEIGNVGGKDILLADAIKQVLAQSISASALNASSSWPMFGGNPQRDLIPAGHCNPSKGHPIPLAAPDYKNLQEAQRTQLTQQYEESSNSGATMGIIPACDRGELFFQDGMRIYAVSLESGTPLPGWARTYNGPRDRLGQYVLPNVWGSTRGFQQTVTLTDHQVLAVMGQTDHDAMQQVGIPVGQWEAPRLVCLDRQSGRESWVVSPANVKDLPKNEDEKTIRTLQLSGSPLVVSDSVLCIGRTNRGQGEDCYVLAFDLASGHFRWACYIASSGLTPNAFASSLSGVSPDSTSHLAYANGRVYVLTNLGAVAALDAYSGTIIWLDIYPTKTVVMNPMAMRGGFNQGLGNPGKPTLKPWMSNAVIVHDGSLFVLPNEGNFLLIYDAGSGKEVKRIDLDQMSHWDVADSERVDKPCTLIGVNGDNLVMTGEHRLICLKWREYDSKKFPGENDRMIQWKSVAPSGLRGRCFMTSDALYAPGVDHLFQYDMRNGCAVVAFPPGKWEDIHTAPGNVTVSGDYMVVAGSKSVDIYTDFVVATAKLERELALNPIDVATRLRYAEVLHYAGRSDEALARLDQALGLLGGADGLKKAGPSPDRDWAFNDAFSFATEIASTGNPQTRKLASTFFDRAAMTAFAPLQQVNWRLARAKLQEDSKDPTGAVRLYQQVLSDPTLRAISLAGDSDEQTDQAQDVAEREINRLVHANGPELYAEYENAAAAVFDGIKSNTDHPRETAARLLDIAQTYPNSNVAPKATLLAADSFEHAGQSRDAIRVLRQMWFKYTQPGRGTSAASISRVQLAEAMARNYLLLADPSHEDKIAAAAARLAQAAQLPGDPKLSREMKLPDGHVLPAGTTFADALDQVRSLHSKELVGTLPDFHIPARVQLPGGRRNLSLIPFANEGMSDHVLSAGAADVLPGVTVLVPPARDFGRNDRIVGFDGSKVLIFSVQAGAPAALVSTNDAFAGAAPASAPPRGVAWSGDTALVWGSGMLVDVDSASGKTIWLINLATLGALDVVHSNEVASASDVQNPVPFRAPNGMIFRGNVVLNGGGQVFIRGGRGGMVAVGGVQAGAVPVPVPPADDKATEQVAECRPVGDRIVVTTTTGRLLSADLSTGKIAWQTRLADRAPDHLAVSEDFTVAKVSDEMTSRLFALDTFSGRILGSKSYSLQAQPTGVVMAPVNVALSPDGTLVYTMPDRLCLKDLYKPWSEEDRFISAPSGQAIYQGASQPGQLLISEGRILALSDNAPPATSSIKWVRVHSLETGQPLQLKYIAADGTNKEMDCVLTTQATDWSVQMHLVGPNLYLCTPRTINHYNLDSPQDTWVGPTDVGIGEGPEERANYQKCLIGRFNVVALHLPTEAQAAPNGNPREYKIVVLNRRPTSTPGKFARESGRSDFIVTLTDPSGILPNWQDCDGGLVYATGDGKVHFLRGSAQ